MPSEIAAPAARHPLIDCRLDTLDRLLIGTVPRGDRVEIVRAVEERIREMLAGSKQGEPSDEQVLGVLSRLDPPEALLPSRFAGPSDAWHAGLSDRLPPFRRPVLKAAVTACGLAAFSFLLLLAGPYFYILASMGYMAVGTSSSEYVVYAVVGVFLALLLGSSIAAAGMALYAFVQLRRRRGTHAGYGWATAALVASTIPMMLGGLAALYAGKALTAGM